VRDAYEAAQKAIRDANAKTTDPVELEKSLKVHVAQYPAIAVITQMRKIRREKFNVKIRTQRTLDEILNHVLPPNDKEGVVTNGHWVTSEGSGLAGKVYRYIRRHPRARNAAGHTRVPIENECNSSCKCSKCLALQKMYHPKHCGVI